jgi:hypothetical protein
MENEINRIVPSYLMPVDSPIEHVLLSFFFLFFFISYLFIFRLYNIDAKIQNIVFFHDFKLPLPGTEAENA